MQSSSGYHHTSSSGTNTNSNSNTRHQHHRHVQSQMSAANTQERLEQLFDEEDHKRCSEGNRKALLAENLDQLRGLTKVLEADDWKYQPNNNNNNNTGGFAWASMTQMPSSSDSGMGGP